MDNNTQRSHAHLAPLISTDRAAVFHAGWRDLAAHLRATIANETNGQTVCDALIVDAPYSDRTHDGDASRPVGKEKRRSLVYSAWSEHEVTAFVREWSPITRGWFVSMTDHTLVPHWMRALESEGRYVFSPIAYIKPGGTVRLHGDGPSQWSVWIIVARPRVAPFIKWGSLPGGYVHPGGFDRETPVYGGKPIWIMERLIEDYSRPNQVIVDPCCGAGTTVLAALQTGRRAIGGDIDAVHARMAADRITGPVQSPLFVR